MKRQIAILENQMSLFDSQVYTGQQNNFWTMQSMAKNIKQIVEEEGIESYLQKGEKILTLAREKAKRKKFVQNAFLECFNFKVFSGKEKKEDRLKYIFQSIRNKFIAPAMEVPLDEEKGLRSLLPWIESEIFLEEVKEDAYEDKLVRTFFINKSTCNYKGALCMKTGNLEPVFMPIGKNNRLTQKQSGYEWHLKSNRKEERIIVDAPLYLCRLVLLFQLRKMVQEIIDKEKDIVDNVVYQYIQRAQDTILECKCIDNVAYIQESCAMKNYIISCLERHKIKWEVTKEKDSAITFSESDFIYEFLLTKEAIPSDWVFQIGAHTEGKNAIISLTCAMNKPNLLELFEKLFSEYITEKEEDEFNKSLEAEYARSYQTKHNIPEKVLRAMETSGWNEFFGYVEFDEDCDLGKLDELVKEFTALALTFQWKKREDVVLRFRRLGKYKANGLYFPNLKCICVDIHSPSSMVHEYFHMLDYEADSASRKAQFYMVYERYCSLLDDFAKKHKDHVLNGNTQYNLSYYKRHTEVFARCGEIYFVRIKGIDNSLVKPDSGFAYPDDTELNMLIEEYFASFLNRIV